MKQINVILQIFAYYISSHLIHAGTKVWTADEETISTSNLFSQYCSGPNDRGSNGRISWICKRPLNKSPIVETHLHTVEVEPVPQDKQVIFVESPPNLYTHKVFVKAQVDNPKTRIYILPGEQNHNFQVTEDIQYNVTSDKPSVLFLNQPIVRNMPDSAVISESDTSQNTFSEFPKPKPSSLAEYNSVHQRPAKIRRSVRAVINVTEKRNFSKET